MNSSLESLEILIFRDGSKVIISSIIGYSPRSFVLRKFRNYPKSFILQVFFHFSAESISA